MKRSTSAFIFLPMISFFLIMCTTQKPMVNKNQLVKEIISNMTLEQKAQYVVGTGMFLDLQLPDHVLKQMEPLLKQYGWMNKPDPSIDPNYTKMVDRVRTYLPGTAGVTSEFPELEVYSQVLTDGPAGLRIQDNATAFPIATLLASSWDTTLVYQVGETIGKEMLKFGSDVLLAPGMNLQRDPLCGRNFEYYSEDPLVTGKMASAMVRGVQSNGVGTSVKHFAVNNQETNRMTSNSIVSTRALRELYLKGFEIVIKEARPWTVMSSYNLVNGAPASESPELLTSILRDDWGFEGYVMTDWMGGTDPIAQMKAGNDMIMPGRPELFQEIIKAVQEKKLDEAVLDKNIGRILHIMMKAPRYRKSPTIDADLKTHAEVARNAAAQGMILMKNQENTLPISSKSTKVAVFGTTSYEPVIGGTGSGDVNEAYTISLVEGLRNAGFRLDENLDKEYNKHLEKARAVQGPSSNFIAAMMGQKEPLPEMPVTRNLTNQVAESADVAMITIGRNAGEGGDRKAVEGDFYLTPDEKQMITDVSESFRNVGKRVIVVLNVGGIIETSSWSKFADAILCAWQPGQETGNAIADVVSGRVNPSGKLTATFPVSYDDTPTAKNFPGTPIKTDKQSTQPPVFSLMPRIPTEVIYAEDIYVGYRYYNTFQVPVAFPFGHGLSYTDFEYQKLKIDSGPFDGSLSFSVEIKNTGKLPGKEVVQAYVSAPGIEMDKPESELVAFGKTRLLGPRDSQVMTFDITTTDIASFDETSSSWIAEKGTYTLKIGTSSTNILQKGTFTLSEARQAGTVSRSLLPNRNIEKLFNHKRKMR